MHLLEVKHIEYARLALRVSFSEALLGKPFNTEQILRDLNRLLKVLLGKKEAASYDGRLLPLVAVAASHLSSILYSIMKYSNHLTICIRLEMESI